MLNCNYDVTVLSLLRSGAGHSHTAPWGTALDEVRKVGNGHLLYHAQWLPEDVVAGDKTPPPPRTEDLPPPAFI